MGTRHPDTTLSDSFPTIRPIISSFPSVTTPEADFQIDVYKKIQAYLAETKMPPGDISSTSGFITSVEQAKQFWNDWSPWIVTEDVFELTTEAQVDAFLEIAEKNKL